MSTFDGSKVINHVALVMAMEAEANPFIEHLHLQLVENTRNVGACKVYQGSVGSGRITLILPGKDATLQVDNVGTTPAAISTFVAATHFQPDIVVNAGTAGGFVRNGAQIGDAFVGVACAHHDRRIAIPGFTEYGIANYKTLDTPNMIKTLGYKIGLVTTSNSLDHCAEDDVIMLQNNASVKDMEAASIAWVCQVTNTPLIVLKVITDIVDGGRPTHDEFMENLSAASKALQQQLPLVIDFVVGKTFSDL